MLIEIVNATVRAAVSTLGAELVSFKRQDGFELLWQGDPKYWAGQAPVLFPVVGALRNGRVMIEGKWYEMGRHGFARKMSFTLAEQKEDRVVLQLTSSAETKVFYPYDFIFTVAYTLCDKGLETRFTVKNSGKEVLPFAVGGHPGYNIPMAEGECFEDYNIEFEKPENQRCPEIDLAECLIDFEKCTKELVNERIIPLRHELFARDALVFENLNSGKVSLKSQKSGCSVTMDFSGFPMLGIWSCVGEGPYVALEPWTGCATTTAEGDRFEDKRNMIFLPQGQEASFAFTSVYN